MIDENEFFSVATLLICSSLNVDTALQSFIDYLKTIMPVSGVIMGVYDPTMNIGYMLSAIWPPKWEKPPEIISFSKEMGTYMNSIWNHNEKITIINDTENETPERRAVIRSFFPDDSSHLNMKLELDDKHLGTVDLLAEGKNRFTERHGRLLSLLHEPLSIAISNVLQYREISKLKDLLAEDNRDLRRKLRSVSNDQIIGAEFGLKDVMQMVRQVSSLSSPVLILGETGVGKEVIANAIHENSERKDKAFVKVNCGAIPENLIDSELFGHEKGAFTGALSQRRGFFERAHTGTIFLDEIGELPLAAQVRLLRVLQHQEIERIGGSRTIHVDVRIISATHQNLALLAQKGRFREDLLFRLNVFPISIPPLRARAEDIPALFNYFVEKKCRELNIRNLPSLDMGTMDHLQSYSWPGNIRELENLVERSLIRSQISGGDRILKIDEVLLAHDREPNQSIQRGVQGIRPLDEVMSEYIKKALKITSGKVEGEDGAAKTLGIHPSTLRARMRKLGIAYGTKVR